MDNEKNVIRFIHPPLPYRELLEKKTASYHAASPSKVQSLNLPVDESSNSLANILSKIIPDNHLLVKRFVCLLSLRIYLFETLVFGLFTTRLLYLKIMCPGTDNRRTNICATESIIHSLINR